MKINNVFKLTARILNSIKADGTSTCITAGENAQDEDTDCKGDGSAVNSNLHLQLIMPDGRDDAPATDAKTATETTIQEVAHTRLVFLFDFRN